MQHTLKLDIAGILLFIMSIINQILWKYTQTK